MLDALARRAAPEEFTLASQPAAFEGGGMRVAGSAQVAIARTSLSIRFTPDGDFSVPKAGYGESNGRVAAGEWVAENVNDAGQAKTGGTLFGTMALRIGAPAQADAVAATRIVVAGDAWQGSGTLGARNVIVQPLSSDVTSFHDRRLAIVADGNLDNATIETMGRACSFVAGIDVEILRVERFDRAGTLLEVEHRRGFRRLGRGTHCPFTGVPYADRMRAWLALVDAFPALIARSVPIDMIVDQISAHNQVAQINVSATLLLQATQTAAHANGPRGLAGLSERLGLGVTNADVERFDALRVELFESGFFHAPGYETGRPQKDIKFLRDLAHTTVLRLCGYTGPFYGAERFVVRELAAVK